MKDVRKCPKCGGEMKNGYVRGSHAQMYPVHFTDKVSSWGGGKIEDTCALASKNCGYIELHIEKKVLSHDET
jgi:hypothetical protein